MFNKSSLLITCVPILAITLTSATIFNGMTKDLGRAFGRLSHSGPKPYQLMAGVKLTPSSSWNASSANTTAHLVGRTLIESVTDVLKTHRLQWSVAPGLLISLFATDNGQFRVQASDNNIVQDSSRTFGMMRRMKMALLPIMFKLGVITTLLILLTAFAFKGLTIGIILIIMTTVGLLSKLHIGHSHDAQKDVHVHVHGGSPGWHHEHHPWDREGYGYPSYPSAQGYYGYLPQQPKSTSSPWAQYF